MNKIIALLALFVLSVACSSKKEGNMIVQGTIKGLRKGTLYLQKMKDTVLVSVDSIALSGTNKFVLTDEVDSPMVYYLTFDGNTTDKRILFFGDKGTITINDDVKLFGYHPEILGSKNQKIFDNFMKINLKFRDQRLDFIKNFLEAKKANNQKLVQQLEKKYQQMIKRRYLYATNFAISNASSEVAPYIALTELYNANLKLLDTINNSLSKKVKKSIYGKRLQNYIDNVKEKK